MINNKIVVLGGDHYNTLWTIRSLGIVGIKSFVIINTDCQRSFVTKSKYVQKYWFAKTEQQILDILANKIENDSRKTIIICSSDVCADLIDRNYTVLNEKFILPNINNQGNQVSYWMNKDVMSEAAREAGFNVPKTWHFNSLENNVDLPTDIIYPCILKPQKSSMGSKYDFSICENESQLRYQLQELKKRETDVILQEYLKPDFEISFLGVNLPNAGKNVIPGLLYKLGTCQSVHNMGMPTYACVHPNLEPYIDIDVVNRYFDKIRYYGLYSIEFFVTNQKPYFLEINLRTDGDMFVYTKAGVNMPLLWVLDVTGHDIQCYKQQVNKVVYGMTEISYIKYLDKKKWWKIFGDLWRSKCFSIFNIRDVKPFIYKFIYSLH